MAVTLKDSWLLLGLENGTEQSGTGASVKITTPNGKMVIVSGDASAVQIEVQGQGDSGVLGDWVPLQDGAFTAPGARYIEGIDRAFNMRAVSTGAVIVQVFK